MAEVQNLATSTVATDIPIGGDANSGVVNASPVDAGVNDVNVAVELGTSPTQERSSNSLLHDSEYDTASDLEGGEEYDDDEDDDDDDLDDEEDDMTDEDDDENIEDDDDVEHPTGIGAGSQEKVSEAEIQKKVDEDRSNPQYIPKRGTFYEHDDRMADGENDGVLAIGDAPGMEGSVGNAGANSKSSSQAPIISHASKTMKKWQAASGDDCWKHDRFDAGEQQPKSRSELISAYGYDIRSEDAPPRARRRRRYARGPTKYSRKWEDESAYIKASNKERKPPRASDFPALNERGPRRPRKDLRERDEDLRDEKENRPERRRTGGSLTKSSVSERLNIAAGRPSQPEERQDREDLRNRSAGKSKPNARQPAGVGRQPAMEFKQKSRNVKHTPQHGNNTQNNGRFDERFERQGQRSSHNQQSGNYSAQNQNASMNDQHQQRTSMKNSSSSSPTVHMKQMPHIQGDIYNNNNQTGGPMKSHDQHSFPPHHQMQPSTPQQQSQQPQQQQQGMSQMRQSIPLKGTPPPSNLSQRLQQVQNRNDPSHVGSVQMHALASQNQQHQQLVMGQQSNTNAMLISAVGQQQQQQQVMQTPSQEQRGPPKRYSSMRRSQHDTQQISEPHPHQQQQQQLQQMHMQQPPPQQAQQAPQALILPDQHILQANLLQLYHQENLQAQMQALQVSQAAPAAQGKQAAYAPVPVPPSAAQTAPPQAYGANPPNAAYYVTDAYGAATAAAPPQSQAAQYAPQPPTYLAPTQAYASQPQPAPNALPGGPPPYGGPAPAGPPAAPNANQNYTNYQNYNTVGGTTYFVPPTQTTTRPVVLPQRRLTNAIPILPPAEKNKQRNNESNATKDDNSKTSAGCAAIGSAENIDHILDNMFVQRAAFQPPAMTATPTNSNESSAGGTDTQSQTPPVGSGDESNLASNNSISTATEPGTNTAAAVGSTEGSVASGNPVESSNNSVTSAAQE